MTIVLISALAIACLLTAIESLIISLNKWRGLLALVFSIPICISLGCHLRYLTAYSLAATFLGLTTSLMVEQTFTGVSSREMRGLPKRVDRM
jgi:uncharacterized protein involved in cysteine biosynthesis